MPRRRRGGGRPPPVDEPLMLDVEVLGAALSALHAAPLCRFMDDSMADVWLQIGMVSDVFADPANAHLLADRAALLRWWTAVLGALTQCLRQLAQDGPVDALTTVPPRLQQLLSVLLHAATAVMTEVLHENDGPRFAAGLMSSVVPALAAACPVLVAALERAAATEAQIASGRYAPRGLQRELQRVAADATTMWLMWIAAWALHLGSMATMHQDGRSRVLSGSMAGLLLVLAQLAAQVLRCVQARGPGQLSGHLLSDLQRRMCTAQPPDKVTAIQEAQGMVLNFAWVLSKAIGTEVVAPGRTAVVQPSEARLLADPGVLLLLATHAGLLAQKLRGRRQPIEVDPTSFTAFISKPRVASVIEQLASLDLGTSAAAAGHASGGGSHSGSGGGTSSGSRSSSIMGHGASSSSSSSSTPAWAEPGYAQHQQPRRHAQRQPPHAQLLAAAGLPAWQAAPTDMQLEDSMGFSASCMFVRGHITSFVVCLASALQGASSSGSGGGGGPSVAAASPAQPLLPAALHVPLALTLLELAQAGMHPKHVGFMLGVTLFTVATAPPEHARAMAAALLQPLLLELGPPAIAACRQGVSRACLGDPLTLALDSFIELLLAALQALQGSTQPDAAACLASVLRARPRAACEVLEAVLRALVVIEAKLARDVGPHRASGRRYSAAESLELAACVAAAVAALQALPASTPQQERADVASSAASLLLTCIKLAAGAAGDAALASSQDGLWQVLATVAAAVGAAAKLLLGQLLDPRDAAAGRLRSVIVRGEQLAARVLQSLVRQEQHSTQERGPPAAAAPAPAPCAAQDLPGHTIWCWAWRAAAPALQVLATVAAAAAAVTAIAVGAAAKLLLRQLLDPRDAAAGRLRSVIERGEQLAARVLQSLVQQEQHSTQERGPPAAAAPAPAPCAAQDLPGHTIWCWAWRAAAPALSSSASRTGSSAARAGAMRALGQGLEALALDGPDAAGQRLAALGAGLARAAVAIEAAAGQPVVVGQQLELQQLAELARALPDSGGAHWLGCGNPACCSCDWLSEAALLDTSLNPRAVGCSRCALRFCSRDCRRAAAHGKACR